MICCNAFATYGNAILVGSQSFWEGVDVRGEALSLVVIDKIPFAPPDDPVLSARIEQMRQQGRNRLHGIPVAARRHQRQAGRRPADSRRKRYVAC
jgi:ATP-dependent DNA helicase DinG